MNRRLTILFVPIDAFGHVNAAIGMAQALVDSGHRVVFAITEGSVWRGRLKNYGFEETLLEYKDETIVECEEQAKNWTEQVMKLVTDQGVLGCETPLQSLINVIKHVFPPLFEKIKEFDKSADQLFKDIRPDAIVLDQICDIPSVLLSGIPWVLVNSCNPLHMIEDERTPPGASGISTLLAQFMPKI